MNTGLHQAAQQYVGIWEGRLVAHTGIVQFPMRKGWKRVHRFVVLPDYQGCGIGTAFIDAVAKIVESEGFALNLTTTTPALAPALIKSPSWLLTNYGKLTKSFSKIKGGEHLDKTRSANRITYSFWHKKGK